MTISKTLPPLSQVQRQGPRAGRTRNLRQEPPSLLPPERQEHLLTLLGQVEEEEEEVEEEEKNLDEIGTEATNCLTVRSISCGSSGGGNEYSITWGKYWTNRNLNLIDTNFTISNKDRHEILSYTSRSSIIRATLSLGLNGEMVERPRRLIAKWTCKIDEFRIRRTCKTNIYKNKHRKNCECCKSLTLNVVIQVCQ